MEVRKQEIAAFFAALLVFVMIALGAAYRAGQVAGAIGAVPMASIPAVK
jgi:hypothetical protein